MKLAIVGAGSTRLPLMLASVAAAGRTCRLDAVTLFDVRPERVRTLLPVGRILAGARGTLPPVDVARTADEALEGADAVVYTVRPGFEEGRARDERTCLSLGVLGQETTGPAGFAFATRSVPAVLAYCEVAARSNPACLPVVFTNPAGMVTQALADAGFDRAVGVCDSATGAAHALARRAGVLFDNVDFEVYGLNHLSWTRRARAGDRDLLAEGLAERAFLERLVPWGADRVAAMGRVPVEYLYYWYRAADALAAMRAEPRTRGEALVRDNAAMLADVGAMAAAGETAAATLRYATYLAARNDSYMDYARGDTDPANVAGMRRFADADAAIAYLDSQVGGYAEVAMELLAGHVGAVPRRMALNVRSAGTMPGFEDDDVVETDCDVDAAGVRPRSHAPLPADDLALANRVKDYERLAVRAIREGSEALAVDALVAHPLVDDRALARRLVGALGICGAAGS